MISLMCQEPLLSSELTPKDSNGTLGGKIKIWNKVYLVKTYWNKAWVSRDDSSYSFCAEKVVGWTKRSLKKTKIKWTRTRNKEKSGLLSVLEMTLDDPSILKKSVGTFVVSKIDTFSSIADHISCSWISSRTISDQLLQVSNIIRRNWGRRLDLGKK